jgi:replicative DNA helicase
MSTTENDKRIPPAKAARSQSKASYAPDPHRILPQSPDGEKGVLSSMLINSSEICGMCAEKGVTKEAFFIPAHATIYETIMARWDANKPIDFITLTEVLRDKGQLDQCGGAAFVTELFTFLPTAANAGYYIEILQEKHTLREIIKICTEFAARSYEEQDDVPALLDSVETEIFRIAQDRFKDRVANMKQLVVQAIGSIEELYSRRGGITGLSTGFDQLDKMTDGLHGGEMIVIAARPSMGKTSLAMGIAEHVAIELKKAVAVFSLEMSTQQLVQRLLCSRARVNLGRVRDGFLSERDFPALNTAATKLAESKIFIDDTSGLTILELRAKARRLKSQHDIQAIFVDYLQLLRSATKRAQDNRQLEISEISAGLKGLAKELGIPVVVAAQLNRNPELRTGEGRGRPRLADLRESGSIEQDADLVGLLVRDEYYADDENEKKELAGKATLIIAKQRNGPVGDVPLTFLKEFTRFENRAEDSDAEGGR